MKSNPEMAKAFKVYFLLLMMMLGSLALFGQPDTELFEQGNKAFMDQEYTVAVEKYEKLIQTGNVAAEVYYNLGNAYYKTGNIASSILNYERALRLNPSDDDITYNLRIAYLATIDKIEPVPVVFYEKWWNDFVNGGSVNTRAVLTVVLFWISLILASVYLFSTRVTLRKIMFFGSLIFLFSGFFAWYLTYSQHQYLTNNKAALIFTESAYVKSSPDNKSANLFMLHSGTRIDVIDELQDWKKIRIANGNEGWIEKKAIEII